MPEPARQPIWTRQLVLLLVTVAFGLTTLNLALPVLPLSVAQATGNTGLAGVVTATVAVLTVIFELQAPHLLRRIRPVRLLVAGLLVEMIAMAGFAEIRALPAMLFFGGLVGAGFGTVATVSTILVGRLAPPGRRGEAIGYYGLAASLPSVVGQPAGLLLLDAFGLGAVFWAGSATSLVGFLLAAFLRPAPQPAAVQPTGGLVATLTTPRVLLIWGSFVCVTFTFGGIVSFTPFLLRGSGLGSAPAFLLVAGLARTSARTFSGRVIDRLGDWRPVWPLLLLGALGLALLPLRQPALTMLAALLFGAGLGVAQTSAFIGMLRSTDPSRSGMVGGLWNVAVDVGFATSALLLAPLAASIGYPAMFWTLPALFLAALAARTAERRMRE
jgi:predicted MFS family arabinose efflux permease